MNSVVTIRKEVKQLKQRLTPGKPTESVQRFLCMKEYPHGTYGYCKMFVSKQDILHDKQEALDEKDELLLMKLAYEKMPDRAKRKMEHSSWATLEDYIDYHKCKCGRFGHHG